MLDPAIQNFLDERKENWLKNKITGSTSEKEKEELERRAIEAFCLEYWLPEAAKRAKQLSLVSHPGKFSHPSAKISPIIASSQKSNDGYLRSGNACVDLDVIGNAAALDVYRFLSVKLTDGKTILNHLEQDTPHIRTQLSISNVPYPKIAKGLLGVKYKNSDEPTQQRTSEKIKQVFFPINKDSYHLLSVLTPSSLVFELKQRISEMHFSDQAKAARDAKKNRLVHDNELSEIYHLTEIGYGGTKPQNISLLNNQFGGTAYLLSSMPPQLEKRNTFLPKNNFFGSYLRSQAFINEFIALAHIFSEDKNSKGWLKRRDKMIKNIIYHVADRLWKVRYVAAGWSDAEHFKQLPRNQKIWLDQKYTSLRERNLGWFHAIKHELSQWFFRAYQKVSGNQALTIDVEQMSCIRHLIGECEEAIR